MKWKELEGADNIPSHINEYIARLEEDKHYYLNKVKELHEVVIGLNKLLIKMGDND